MATPEEEQADPDGPEAKAEYASRATIVIEALQAMQLLDLADNFRRARVYDDHLRQMSNAEIKGMGFRTMTQAIDFKEKVFALLK
jgi:hypothetical protein